MDIKKDRTLVLGDIHGGLKCLIQVLDRCGFDKEFDKLIFLGDYVDGWSESAQLIQFLIDLQKESKRNHIFLLGNHDTYCRSWLNKSKNTNQRWLTGNGKSTIDSYIKTNYVESSEHIDFFNNLKNYYIDKKNRGFVHGGFTSKNGLGHEPHSSNYSWDRDLWNLAVLQDRKHTEGSEEALQKMRRFEKHKEVYIGHTSTQNWIVKVNMPEYTQSKQKTMGQITVPMNRCNVWNMDTGAGFKGPLSLMDIKTKELWQSDNANEIYSNEIGRNDKAKL